MVAAFLAVVAVMISNFFGITNTNMQYLYTQEEHDRVKTDKEEFERRVNAEVGKRWKGYHAELNAVLVRFLKCHCPYDDSSRHFGVNVSYEHLNQLMREISRACGIKEESCDKAASP